MTRVCQLKGWSTRPSVSSHIHGKYKDSRKSAGILFLEVKLVPNDATDDIVPRHKRDVRNRKLAADEVVLFAQDGFENSEDATGFSLVTCDGRRQLLWVKVGEPGRLTEVWAVVTDEISHRCKEVKRLTLDQRFERTATE